MCQSADNRHSPPGILGAPKFGGVSREEIAGKEATLTSNSILFSVRHIRTVMERLPRRADVEGPGKGQGRGSSDNPST
jgi:hypothetical protein